MGSSCSAVKAVQTADSKLSLPKLKLVIVGESLSGKTSIVERYEKNVFHDDYVPTRSVNILSIVKKVNVPDQGIVSIELWDVPGHEDVDIRKTYYLNADAVIVAVDLSDDDAFSYAIRWKKDVLTHHRRIKQLHKQGANGTAVSLSTEQMRPKIGVIPILLLGNKFDVVKETYLRDQYSMCNGKAEKPSYSPETPSKHGHDLNNNNSDNPVQHENNVALITSEISKSTVNVLPDETKKHNHETLVDVTDNNIKSTSSIGETDNGLNGVPDASESDPLPTRHLQKENSEENNSFAKPEIEVNGETKPTTVDMECEQAVEHERLETDEGNVVQDNIDKKHENSSDSGDIKTVVEGSSERSPENERLTEANHGDGSQKNVEINQMEVSEEIMNQNQSNIDKDGGNVDSTSTKKLKKLSPKDLFLQESTVSTAQNKESLQIPNASLRDLGSSISDVVSMVSLLPPCVEELESFAEENGFIAGIPVSAKDPKGGVDDAIQSLVRHLINKMRDPIERKRKTDEVSLRSHLSGTKRSKKIQHRSLNEEFEPLQEVGIIEIDEVIRSCNPALKDAEDVIASYKEALHEFKRTCYTRQLIGGNQVSIEECVSALKEAVQSSRPPQNEKSDVRIARLLRDDAPRFTLVSSEMDGFIDLQIMTAEQEYVGLDNDGLLPHIIEVIGVYQDKVQKSCSDVVERSSELEQVLKQHFEHISAKEEKAWDTAVAAGHSQSNVRRILTGVAQGKARLRGTLEQIKDARRTVTATQAKIRAALLF